MSDVPFWQHSIDDLNRQLGASPQGLSTAEAARRLTQFGLNESNGQRRAGFGRRLLRRLGNPLVAMLIVTSTIAGISGDLVSFATIVLVVAPGVPSAVKALP